MSYAEKFVSGIGTHAYLNMFVPAFFTNIAHFQFPDLFILSTEFSIGKKHL
jgi:O-Glycosyl hydrolase family 30.